MMYYTRPDFESPQSPAPSEQEEMEEDYETSNVADTYEDYGSGWLDQMQRVHNHEYASYLYTVLILMLILSLVWWLLLRK